MMIHRTTTTTTTTMSSSKEKSNTTATLSAHRSSGKDKAIESQLVTHEHINILHDISNVTGQMQNVLSNKPSKRDISKISNQLGQMQAVVDAQCDKMKEFAKVTERQSKISDISYLASRIRTSSTTNNNNENENKNEQPLASMAKSMASHRLNIVHSECIKGQPVKKKSKKAADAESSHDALCTSVPLPKNGVQYTKMEAVRILDSHPTKADRSVLIDHWIDKKLIPIDTCHAMQKVLRKIRTGKPVSESWGGGRPALMSIESLDKATMKLQQEKGNTLTREGIRSIVEEHQLEKAAARGVVVDSNKKISTRSMRRYLLLAALNKKLSLQTSVINKTDTRFIAENSLISGLSFLLVIAATHFNVGRDGYFEGNARKRLSDGAKLLLDLLEEYHGAPVHPISRKWILSMDDTTEYIFEGTGESR